MKFTQLLASNLTPEWRKQYIDYESLNCLIDELLANAPPAPEDFEAFSTQADERFFNECEKQLTKVNLFFGQKIAEANGKYNQLKQELNGLSSHGRRAHADPQKSMSHMKFAFSEFYLGLVLLQRFQQLNGTGFRKILKKHDKRLQNEKGLEWRFNRVEKSVFFVNREVETLIAQTESIVINQLEEGNRSAGMKRLRVPPLSEKQSAWTTFRLGFTLGCFLILSGLIIVTVVAGGRPREPRWVGVRLFRGFFILFMNIWLMGLNMYGWQSCGVNHILIFEINPRDHLQYQAVMEIGSVFCMVWALCVLGYLHSHLVGVSPLIFPLMLMAFCVCWLANPLTRPAGVMRRSSRYWFAQHIYRCVTAAFHRVSFADFWLADQMNSLVFFFLDMEYFVCFYATQVVYANGTMSFLEQSWDANGTSSRFGIDFDTGADFCSGNALGIRPAIAIMPALIRFVQCLRRFADSGKSHPHLTNAGKYSTTFFVVVFGAAFKTTRKNMSAASEVLFWMWILSYVVSFLYALTWDLKEDWGLMEPKNRLLRAELVYSQKWYYYGAMAVDAVLRLGWVVNVSLGTAWIVESDLLATCTAPFEIFRRFVWNFLRLENEHLNNCGQFRAVRDISLKPIKRGGELEKLMERMDSDDGVSHRGNGAGKQKRQALSSKPLTRKFSRVALLIRSPKSVGRELAELPRRSQSVMHRSHSSQPSFLSSAMRSMEC